jgi:chemosensory pili system protein ChpA (sensor histidine kinase/response regulator)
LQELMETIVQIQEVTEDLQINLGTTERSTRQLTRTSQLLQNQSLSCGCVLLRS